MERPTTTSENTNPETTHPNVFEEIQEKIKSNQTLMNEGKFDEAIESYRACLERASKAYVDEMHPEMAKFYYLYGNAVLYKIEESGEIFGDVVEQAENTKNEEFEEKENDEEIVEKDQKNHEEQSYVIFEDKDTKILDETNITANLPNGQNIEPVEQITFPTQNATSENNNDEIQKSDEKADVPKTEDVDFLQIAWENLEVARVITEKRYQEILNDPKCNKEEVEKLLRQQARIYLRLGDLECWKENFQDGLNEYKKSLEIRMKFESPMLSRDISEIHFLIGNAHLYVGKEDCEEDALKSYNEAKQILENNLKKELGIPFDNQNIFNNSQSFDKNLINESAFDNEVSKELKGTLKMLYEKIEDTLTQKSEKILYKIEKEKMKESSLKENHFLESGTNPNVPLQNTQQIANNKENILTSFPNPKLGNEKEEVKIVNLGVFGNSRKRPSPSTSNGNMPNYDSIKEENQKQNLMPEEKKMKLPEN